MCLTSLRDLLMCHDNHSWQTARMTSRWGHITSIPSMASTHCRLRKICSNTSCLPSPEIFHSQRQALSERERLAYKNSSISVPQGQCHHQVIDVELRTKACVHGCKHEISLCVIKYMTPRNVTIVKFSGVKLSIALTSLRTHDVCLKSLGRHDTMDDIIWYYDNWMRHFCRMQGK